MELTGTIERILNKEQVSDTFVKRSLVLRTNEAYPQKILIEFTQEKISLLDMYREGTDVRISINIRGREWTDREGNIRYFNGINGWKIEPFSGSTESQGSSHSNNYSNNNNSSSNSNSRHNNSKSHRRNNDDDTDDLPF